MTVRTHGTLLFTRSDVRRTLDLTSCIDAVERAFRLHGLGAAPPPAVASVNLKEGGFHVKAGALPVGETSYFVAKTNGNFPGNVARHGLPTIQGIIVVCDADRGTPLAVLDSIEITALRTAAATAVAAKHLARASSKSLAIIGCGLQGDRHVRALALVRQFDRVTLFDADVGSAQALASRISTELGIATSVASTAAAASREADVCVTCTTATTFLLGPDDVAPGAFVAGVGVDSERKRELGPALLARGKVVVDVLAQCVAFGDLHHAIDAGQMTVEQVHAELGAVVAGLRPGREHDDEVIVFDSTGMALQDAAAAALVYERARDLGLGTVVDFGS